MQSAGMIKVFVGKDDINALDPTAAQIRYRDVVTDILVQIASCINQQTMRRKRKTDQGTVTLPDVQPADAVTG